MILGLKNGEIELCDHQIEWEKDAKETMEYLKSIFGNILVDIQHIGSTSIKHIKAKPIIDIVAGINDYNEIDKIMDKLKNNGLIHIPGADEYEFKIFYMEKYGKGIQTHRIHVVRYNNDEWNNKLNFRDYMNGNIEIAKEYESIKIKCMEENKENPANYQKSKENFVKEKIKEAEKWRKNHGCY